MVCDVTDTTLFDTTRDKLDAITHTCFDVLQSHQGFNGSVKKETVADGPN